MPFVTRALPASAAAGTRPRPPRLWRALAGLAPEEALFARRGFHAAHPAARERLETVGRDFLHGYNAALEDPAAGRLAARLEAVPRERRGFAYEGAAMGLALPALVLPWRWRRFEGFLAGPAAPHVYMAHVGAGWALAVLPWGLKRALARLDPLLRWLALDGFGFHHGYFAPRRSVERRDRPRRLGGYALRAFDQGLGRALWFVEGADPRRVAARVDSFPRPRRADLWSGVGLACAYAGGVGGEDVRALRARAGTFRADLAQGAAFAAEARERAGSPAAHTERACLGLCGRSAARAARVARQALEELPEPARREGGAEVYEAWRRRIRERLAPGEEAP